MLRGEILGAFVYLSNADWLTLKKRFTYSNRERRTKLALLGRKIPVGCPLCERYLCKECKGCTLHKFAGLGSYRGCGVVYKEIVGKRLPDIVLLGRDMLYWRAKHWLCAWWVCFKVRRVLNRMTEV